MADQPTPSPQPSRKAQVQIKAMPEPGYRPPRSRMRLFMVLGQYAVLLLVMAYFSGWLPDIDELKAMLPDLSLSSQPKITSTASVAVALGQIHDGLGADFESNPGSVDFDKLASDKSLQNLASSSKVLAIYVTKLPELKIIWQKIPLISLKKKKKTGEKQATNQAGVFVQPFECDAGNSVVKLRCFSTVLDSSNQRDQLQITVYAYASVE